MKPRVPHQKKKVLTDLPWARENSCLPGFSWLSGLTAFGLKLWHWFFWVFSPQAHPTDFDPANLDNISQLSKINLFYVHTQLTGFISPAP
jgi:hypothetical protein